MIEIKNVKKSFDDVEVLKGISSKFEEGKLNMIIGKSGSGKTVLIKCILGIFSLNDGEILFDGRNIAEFSKQEMRNLRMEIGMLFQGNALFDSLNIEKNVSFPLDMFTSMTAKEKRARVDEVLEQVRLDKVLKKMPSEISGGMKKRVGIARAIVLKPKYLFCDEPNSGLDPQTSIVIDELLKEITDSYKMVTITNTHDMNSVITTGDHVLFLHEGKKEWEGSKEEILRTDNETLNDFIFASDFLKELRKNPL